MPLVFHGVEPATSLCCWLTLKCRSCWQWGNPGRLLWNWLCSTVASARTDFEGRSGRAALSWLMHHLAARPRECPEWKREVPLHESSHFMKAYRMVKGMVHSIVIFQSSPAWIVMPTWIWLHRSDLEYRTHAQHHGWLLEVMVGMAIAIQP